MKKILLLLTLFIVSGFYTIGHNQSGDPKAKTENQRQASFTLVDQATKQPVPNTAIYDMNGKELGKSDMKGAVSIMVPSSTKDTYTIMVNGFKPVEINVRYASKKASSYEVLLSASAMWQEEVSAVQHENLGEMQREEVTAAQQEKVKVYVKQDPETYVKEVKPKKEELELVFAVQLSASSRPVTDMKALSSWEQLGPLYVYTENGLYKVRVGPYDTQDQAKQVLLKAKQKGRKDAFIVIQEGLEGYEPLGYVKYVEPMVIDEKFIVSGREPQVTTPKETAVPEAMDMGKAVVEYKVRLASYLKPGGFNTKDIDKYGPLESYRKGEWTIMLIGGFKTVEDAKRVRKAVIAKGYSDAMVVADRGGVLEDVD